MGKRKAKIRVSGAQDGSDYSNSLDLGFELNLGSDNGGDDFFVRKSVTQSGESSGNGLRIVGFESDSDEEEEPIAGIGLLSDREGDESSGGAEDLGLPLCWDCLQLEDRRDPNEDFEWEEVDERVDEREVFSMVIDPDDERSVSSGLHSDESTTHTTVEATLDWEVLLAVNNLDRTPTAEEGPEIFLPDHGYDFINTTEYEVLFGQFAEHENSTKGSPPTAKSVIDNLPSVLLTEEDVRNNNTLCAVCKDEISREEQAKKLPCSHHYHGECIIPWLKITNSCPVCRFELPTDDPDYENWKIQRGARQPTRDSQFRYELEVLPEHQAAL
ncbi:E3 ubiquitin-protein ligase CIP8 isoform X2 [Aristolochia californica]|uniref:E3 ubiquitin-protein ligase CIP8 isoform X2 n=1 Tax=Aristolochia californica TaxID=171875 RepID=UPI0035DF8866